MQFISFLFFMLSAILLSPFHIAHANEKTRDPIEIIMLGDSLTAGYGLEEKDSLPSQLEAALRNENLNVSVINAGVSGDTTAGGLERLEWSLTDTADVLVIALGANDGLRGVAPSFTKDNLEKIIVNTQELRPDIKILLLGMMAPPNLGGQYAEQYNDIYPALAEKYHLPLYPFLLDGVISEKTLNQADGIHPNRKGVDVIVDKIVPFFKDNLDS